MRGCPTRGCPTRGYPTRGYPTGGYPIGGYPIGGYSMGGYPMRDDPMRSHTTGGYPMGRCPMENFPYELIIYSGFWYSLQGESVNKHSWLTSGWAMHQSPGWQLRDHQAASSLIHQVDQRVLVRAPIRRDQTISGSILQFLFLHPAHPPEVHPSCLTTTPLIRACLAPFVMLRCSRNKPSKNIC